MHKRIELSPEGIGRLADCEPFLLPDKLVLEFSTKSYDLSNAFVSLKNGKEEGRFKIKSSKVEVEERFLIAGKLEMEVRLYSGESVVKKWAVIPLKMIETEYGIHAFDFLKELDQRYQKVYEKLNEVIEKHNKLEEHVADMKENY